jgi:hypothetical protein
MNLNADDATDERPRRRLLVKVVAVLLPVVALAGASVWFIRSYVLPPMITIEPLAMASADASEIAPETTGAAPPAAAPNGLEPAVRYTTNSAEIWASVPLPGQPRQVQRLAPEPGATASEPRNGPVPLPPRRPRISGAELDGSVPLPRPRPALASN